jgi:nicotinamidase-related amidase
MALGHYVGAFFSGALLLNTVPHFVKGVCGDKFPTPFAKPPGKGLSSAPVNTVWGLFNLAVGLVLWHVSKPCSSYGLMATFAVGFVVLAVQMSMHFQHKDAV